MHLLFNDRLHAISKLVTQGIQKVSLRFNLLFRESSHGDELLNEPLVSFAKLAQLDVDCLFIDDVNHELTQASVESETIVVGEALFFGDLDLLWSGSLVDPDLLSCEVEVMQALLEVFIHFVVF